ncbi:putative endo-polygalacturonase [Helianthus anomalus]
MVCFLRLSSAANYNIMQFGAKGDGVTDDTKVFERAWQELCNDVEPSSRLTIPMPNTFLVGPITFQGPCKSPLIHIQILGTIMAPQNPSSWNGCETGAWLLFYKVNGLFIDGGGTINGRGEAWWTKSSTYVHSIALHFESCNGLRLTKIKHRNSPRNHIGLNRCSYSTLSYLDIVAPANSPNTDGIDISLSTQVRVHHSIIRTEVIFIGSLGMNGQYNTVEGVKVRKCQFSGTTNGARIKTWQSSAVKVSDISYKIFVGTSLSRTAINFDCSNNVACTGILLDQINITSTVKGEYPTVYCNNAYGTSSFSSPTASCLLN